MEDPVKVFVLSFVRCEALSWVWVASALGGLQHDTCMHTCFTKVHADDVFG